MTSYELASKILELRWLNDEGIIDDDTFFDTVEGLGVDDKLNGLIYASKRVKSEMDMLKEEKKRIDMELKRQEKNQERIKELINMLMGASEKGKFEGVAGKISYRKSTSVEVCDDFIERYKGEFFVVEDTTYKVDKKALKEVLKNCEKEVYGAKLVESNNIQIK